MELITVFVQNELYSKARAIKAPAQYKIYRRPLTCGINSLAHLKTNLPDLYIRNPDVVVPE